MQPAIGVTPSRREPDVPRRNNPGINPPSIHAAFEDEHHHENLAWFVDHPDPEQRMHPGGPRHIVRHVWSRKGWSQGPTPVPRNDIQVDDLYAGDDPNEAAHTTVTKLSDLMRQYGPPEHLRPPFNSSDY
jgi:hypothetical protein